MEGWVPNVQNPFNVPSAHRKVFFTDYGQIPKVERCDMDGQNRTKLVDSKIVFPHGITLDLVSRLVYWADAYLDYIEVVDYEGKGRQTIIQGILVRRKPLQGTTAGWQRGGPEPPGRERAGHGHFGERTGYDFHSDGNSYFRDTLYFPFLI